MGRTWLVAGKDSIPQGVNGDKNGVLFKNVICLFFPVFFLESVAHLEIYGTIWPIYLPLESDIRD